jgi:integrase
MSLMAVYKDGDTWRYRKRIQVHGQTIRISGTPNVNTQKAAEAAERGHIERAEHPERYAAPVKAVSEPRKVVPTFREFSEKFLAEWPGVKKPSARDGLKSLVKMLMDDFGDLRLDEIDQSAINRHVKRVAHLSSGTVNNRLSCLSSILEYAAQCKLISRPDRDDELVLHVDDDRDEDDEEAKIQPLPAGDVDKLLAAATNKRDRLVVLLCSQAGLRVGEVLGAQWTNIKNGVLTIRQQRDGRGNLVAPKHDKVRHVPLSAAILKLLERMPKRGLYLVCKSSGDPLLYQGLRLKLVALYAAAGVTVPATDRGVRRPFHSLRHSFGTEMVRRGVALPVLQELMGHRDIKTTMVYVSTTDDDKRDAITRAFGQNLANDKRDAQQLVAIVT